MNKIISKKLIKPHTSTPPNLKNYNISFLDKNIHPMNIAVLLFYQSKPQNKYPTSLLEESLAKILVQFYLLAGRYIENDNMVDCSDQGVEFVEAEALHDVVLTDLVAETIYADQINHLLPDHYFQVDDAPTNPLMSIQATHFPCGGLTIGISVSHRVFDVASLWTFISSWSKSDTTSPSIDLPLLLPCKDQSHTGDKIISPPRPRIVVKRLVFSKAALTILKSKIRRRNGKPVSGARVVCAVIAKALIKVDKAKHGRNRDFKIFQPVNMRERTIPPVSKHACGNMSVASVTRRVDGAEAKEIGVEELVNLIGDGIRKSIFHHAEMLSPNIDGRDIITNYSLVHLKNLLMNPEMNAIIFSDWSQFGFYEADFGWGKPVWTSIGPQHPSSNSTVLMSNKEGDGIEAWLHLNEQDMLNFEQDEEIKLFTT